MLASTYRLTKKSDIEKVKEEGRLYRRSLFGALVLKKNNKENSRFACIVSTKISKRAFQRNRVKRALREAVRHHLFIIGKGYDILFLPKTNIVRKTTEEIMKDVKLFILKDLS